MSSGARGCRSVLAVLAVGAVAAGCADAPVPRAAPPVSSPAAPAPVADPRAADVAFARMMIPHHEQALELSALVPGRAASPEVAELAFRIDRDQVEEIGQMQGLLRAWGEEPGAGGTAGMRGMRGMRGMADPSTLDRLRASSGPAFDRLWRDTMIAHHEGAIAMADDLLASTGGRSTLTEFARMMIVTQRAEIVALART